MSLTLTLERLEESTQALSQQDFSNHRTNLSDLGVGECDSLVTPVVRFRKVCPRELNRSGPHIQRQCQHIMDHTQQFGGMNKECMESKDFEELYERTVDLAEFCNVDDINDRLDHIAIRYDTLAESSQVLRNQLNEIHLTLPDANDGENDVHALTDELQRLQRENRQVRSVAAKKRKLLDQINQQIRNRQCAPQRDQLSVANLGGSWDVNQVAEIQRLQDLVQRKTSQLAQRKLDVNTTNRFHGLLYDPAAKDLMDWSLLDPIVAMDQTLRIQPQLHPCNNVTSPPRANLTTTKTQEKLLGLVNKMVDTTSTYDAANRLISRAIQRTISTVADSTPDNNLETIKMSADTGAPTTIPVSTILTVAVLKYLCERNGAAAFQDLKNYVGKIAASHQVEDDQAIQNIYIIAAKGWITIHHAHRDRIVKLNLYL
ncbi:hypothetical protein IWQ61_005059 [Dispira simplex]|nr:hypothetical protein IWQ61_005059 [Dispira simplex]